MKRFQFLPVSSPLVEVECNGVVNKSDYIENVKKNPNFKKRIISLDVVSITHGCMAGKGTDFTT